ncbi:homeobox protein Hox-D3-like [Watersipora subatra]|uniref:homeobox protein Hox-D3-like n=1 Tax=Watersipora subatra TaxID=2589382 RepID=UPI00355B6255
MLKAEHNTSMQACSDTARREDSSANFSQQMLPERTFDSNMVGHATEVSRAVETGPQELKSSDYPWGGVDASSYQEWLSSLQQQYQALGKSTPNWARQKDVCSVSSKHSLKSTIFRKQNSRSEGMRDVKQGLQTIINKYAKKAQETEAVLLRDIIENNRNRRPYYSASQIRKLESMFRVNRYPSVNDKLHLAEALNISVKQVSVWFQNRRCKEKRKVADELTHRPITSQRSHFVNILPSQTAPAQGDWSVWDNNPNLGVESAPGLALPVSLQSTEINTASVQAGAPEATVQIQQTVGMMERMEL